MKTPRLAESASDLLRVVGVLHARGRPKLKNSFSGCCGWQLVEGPGYGANLRPAPGSPTIFLQAAAAFKQRARPRGTLPRPTAGPRRHDDPQAPIRVPRIAAWPVPDPEISVTVPPGPSVR